MNISFKDNAPYSERFEDIYFNPKEGLAETEHVFLNANDLKSKMQARSRLTIGELGFGTGLNFLATLHLWQSLPEPNAELHYFSIEKYPLSLEMLQKSHALFPGLAPQAAILHANYPPILQGFHAIAVISNQVFLYLLIGDVENMLPQIEGPINVWFLDGFAPSKNKDMWSETVFKEIAIRSDSQTSLSTFSAAGWVRKNLANNHFTVDKITGFGQKREMIRAHYTKPFTSIIPRWFARPTLPSIHKVAIVGAGLAGLMSAWHLQEAGVDVEVFDTCPTLPNRQSQNPAMLLKPYLSPNHNFFDQYYTQGFLGMVRFIETIAPGAIISEGLLDLAVNEKKQDKFKKLLQKCVIPETFAKFLNPEDASKVAGIPLVWPALYYKTAKVIDPAKLIERLLILLKDKITIHLNQSANSLQLSQHFDAVILATGALPSLINFNHFKLSATPGQVSIFSANPVSQNLKIALAYEGYCVRDGRGRNVVGSSFRHHSSLEISAEEHLQNLNYLNKAAPLLAERFAKQDKQGFTAMRLKARDHLPLVGPLPLQDQWHKDFERLRYGDRQHPYPDATYMPKIYLNLAHGSKGLSSSFMASKILTALLTERPLPIGLSLLQAIHPARFWHRNLKCEH